jgi:hypothetical protein
MPEHQIYSRVVEETRRSIRSPRRAQTDTVTTDSRAPSLKDEIKLEKLGNCALGAAFFVALFAVPILFIKARDAPPLRSISYSATLCLKMHHFATQRSTICRVLAGQVAILARYSHVRRTYDQIELAEDGSPTGKLIGLQSRLGWGTSARPQKGSSLRRTGPSEAFLVLSDYIDGSARP